MAEADVDYEPIARVSAPSVERFREEYVVPRRAVVLTGLIDDWPARKRWSLDYFSSVHAEAKVAALPAKNGLVDVTEYGGGLFSRLRLGDFAAALRSGEAATRYVAAPFSNLPAAMLEDFSAPRYCAGAEWLRPKFWLGGKGTVTPLHWDLPQNLSAQVFGRRRWLLYPGNQWPLLYPCRPWSRAPNFSRVDPEAPDLERFPRFARARPLGTVLLPGETLYIPSFWWHHVRALDDNSAISFWFGGAAIAAAGSLLNGFKRATGLFKGEWD